jgi:hypothetical protein
MALSAYVSDFRVLGVKEGKQVLFCVKCGLKKKKSLWPPEMICFDE